MGAEDVRDLQLWSGHPGVRSLQTSLHRLILQLGQHLVGADGVPDRLGRHVGVSRSSRQFGAAEQHLVVSQSFGIQLRCWAWRARSGTFPKQSSGLKS